MNTYLIPYFDGTDVNILKITANSLESAKEKIQDYYADKYDSDELANACTYDDFVYILADVGICLGEIHGIEEYE